MTTIRLRQNGPYVIDSDDVRVVDWTGAEYHIDRRPVALCRCAFRPASQCFLVLSEVGRQRRDTFAKPLRPDGSRADPVRDGRKPGERANLEPA